MKILCVLLLCGALTGVNVVAAQTPDRLSDSLQSVLRAHPGPDTVRVRTLVALASRLNSAQPPEAAAKAREGLRLARQLHFARGETGALMQLGVCAYERGDLDSAEVFFANSAALARAQHLERSVLRAQNGLAGVYASRSKFNDALPLFISSLEVAERIGDKKMQIMALSNMGSVAEQLLDEPMALRYYARCLALADTVTSAQAYESCLCNIAGLYLNQKEFAKAMPYVRRALRLNHRTGDAQNRGTMLMALGQIELAQKEPAKAEKNFQSTLALGRKVGDNYLMTRALLLLGKAAEQQQQSAQGLRFYQQALPQALDLGIYEHTKEAYAGRGGLRGAGAIRQGVSKPGETGALCRFGPHR